MCISSGFIYLNITSYPKYLADYCKHLKNIACNYPYSKIFAINIDEDAMSFTYIVDRRSKRKFLNLIPFSVTVSIIIAMQIHTKRI